MFKSKFLLSFSLHAVLGVLILEAVSLVLAWLLFRWWYWLQHFSDVLFLVGVLQLMAASLGMMSRPYEVSNSPWGVPALPVQASEQEKRWQSIATLIEQKSFALRMIVCGVLTILLAVVLTYINP
jgi:hypothetical protein